MSERDLLRAWVWGAIWGMCAMLSIWVSGWFAPSVVAATFFGWRELAAARLDGSSE